MPAIFGICSADGQIVLRITVLKKVVANGIVAMDRVFAMDSGC